MGRGRRDRSGGRGDPTAGVHEGAFQFLKAPLDRTRARDQQEIARGRNQALVFPEKFTQAAFGPVAADRGSNGGDRGDDGGAGKVGAREGGPTRC